MKKFLIYDFALESYVLRDDYYRNGKEAESYGTAILPKALDMAIASRNEKLRNGAESYSIQLGAQVY